MAGMLIEIDRSNSKHHALNLAQIRQSRPDVLLVVALADVSRRETETLSLLLQEFGVTAVVTGAPQFAAAATLIRRRFDCSCRETPLASIGDRR